MFFFCSGMKITDAYWQIDSVVLQTGINYGAYDFLTIAKCASFVIQ